MARSPAQELVSGSGMCLTAAEGERCTESGSILRHKPWTLENIFIQPSGRVHTLTELRTYPTPCCYPAPNKHQAAEVWCWHGGSKDT